MISCCCCLEFKCLNVYYFNFNCYSIFFPSSVYAPYLLTSNFHLNLSYNPNSYFIPYYTQFLISPYVTLPMFLLLLFGLDYYSSDIRTAPKHMCIRPLSSLDRNCRSNSSIDEVGVILVSGHIEKLCLGENMISAKTRRITEATNIYCYQNINASRGGKLFYKLSYILM